MSLGATDAGKAKAEKSICRPRVHALIPVPEIGQCQMQGIYNVSFFDDVVVEEISPDK